MIPYYTVRLILWHKMDVCIPSVVTCVHQEFCIDREFSVSMPPKKVRLHCKTTIHIMVKSICYHCDNVFAKIRVYSCKTCKTCEKIIQVAIN